MMMMEIFWQSKRRAENLQNGVTRAGGGRVGEWLLLWEICKEKCRQKPHTLALAQAGRAAAAAA